nr:DUF2110 family protein [Candidatus Sigynarchaeota archaeon]
MNDISITLLDSVKIDWGRGITSDRLDMLKKSVNDALATFTIEYNIEEIKKENTISLRVTLKGEDAQAARNFLKLKHGARVMLVDLKAGDTAQRGKVDASGSTGFGLFFDVGLEDRNALYPLYRMREQLTDGKKIPARKLAKLFGFCDDYGLPVTVLEIDDKSRVSVELDQRIVDEFKSWREDGLDRVFCHGASMDNVKKALAKSGAKKEHVMVQETGFLDCIITCDKQTNGTGIITLIGPQLPQAKLAVFNASGISDALR